MFLCLLLLNIFYYYLFSDLSFSVHILTLFAALSMGFIYLSLLIPSIYYSGTNGSSIVMLIFILSFSGGAFLINSGTLTFDTLVSIHPLFLACGLLLLVIITLIISLLISIKIFLTSQSR
ncbi:ABC-2 family transporter protein [Paenibacillus algorifonticola]|uniref:ABC-2 family transporter protein n=1 Tax=Paenibacillus algorifonticola TaxID=684063 RepID=A0A1I2J0H2_9BACL|nr:ABC-2 family transporter protein [Paenibacillus algorifonticola]